MTLAELLEKSREYPQNADVFAVPVDDAWNCCEPFLEAVGVLGASTKPKSFIDCSKKSSSRTREKEKRRSFGRRFLFLDWGEVWLGRAGLSWVKLVSFKNGREIWKSAFGERRRGKRR